MLFHLDKGIETARQLYLEINLYPLLGLPADHAARAPGAPVLVHPNPEYRTIIKSLLGHCHVILDVILEKPVVTEDTRPSTIDS